MLSPYRYFPFQIQRLLFSLWSDFIDLKAAYTCVTLHIRATASHLSDLVNSSIWGYINAVHVQILYFVLIPIFCFIFHFKSVSHRS